MTPLASDVLLFLHMEGFDLLGFFVCFLSVHDGYQLVMLFSCEAFVWFWHLNSRNQKLCETFTEKMIKLKIIERKMFTKIIHRFIVIFLE